MNRLRTGWNWSGAVSEWVYQIYNEFSYFFRWVIKNKWTISALEFHSCWHFFIFFVSEWILCAFCFKNSKTPKLNRKRQHIVQCQCFYWQVKFLVFSFVNELCCELCKVHSIRRKLMIEIATTTTDKTKFEQNLIDRWERNKEYTCGGGTRYKTVFFIANGELNGGFIVKTDWFV